MIYPIVAYGDPVLRKEAEDINPDYPHLEQLIQDMFETMYAASGVGLAAPQIGLPIRLFVVDAEPMDEENLKGFKKVFINAHMLDEWGNEWDYEEGCLSIPTIRENVRRESSIKIQYQDEHFRPHTEEFTGLAARVIQHEYDHINGVLFTDHISALKRRLLQNKLKAISEGRVEISYKMKFPKRK